MRVKSTEAASFWGFKNKIDKSVSTLSGLACPLSIDMGCAYGIQAGTLCWAARLSWTTGCDSKEETDQKIIADADRDLSQQAVTRPKTKLLPWVCVENSREKMLQNFCVCEGNVFNCWQQDSEHTFSHTRNPKPPALNIPGHVWNGIQCAHLGHGRPDEGTASLWRRVGTNLLFRLTFLCCLKGLVHSLSTTWPGGHREAQKSQILCWLDAKHRRVEALLVLYQNRMTLAGSKSTSTPAVRAQKCFENILITTFSGFSYVDLLQSVSTFSQYLCDSFHFAMFVLMDHFSSNYACAHVKENKCTPISPHLGAETRLDILKWTWIAEAVFFQCTSWFETSKL